jgi:lipoprotein NlpD
LNPVRRYAPALFGAIASAALIAGCTTTRPAPVSERAVTPRAAATQPAASPVQTSPPARAAASPASNGLYTVKPGDTLYSIALEHRVDYRDLAMWNGIDNPNALKVGQQLRVVGTPVASTATAPSPPAADGAVAAPLKRPDGTIQAKPLGPGPVATPGAAAATAVPGTAAAPSQPGSIAAPSAPAPPGGGIVSEPKGLRLPYSDQALAQLAAPEANQAKAEPRVEMKVPPVSPPTPQSKPDAARAESSDWLWPAKGKVVATFNGTTNKGIDIAGARGQAVLATAPGRVIFSGTGVRGMGKFVVIKHSEDLISVYGHNDEVLVKYGQNVSKGQKIAEMGSTDADQVKLHFEIRRNGTPVDPLTLLPNPA